MQVKATREGLPGQHTASGWRINSHAYFVALPSRAALWAWVEVTNMNVIDPETGTGVTVKARVLDIGPHYGSKNDDDDAYVFGGARPKAESDGSNGAGIDLGEAVWNALGMKDNGPVTWRWLHEA